MKKFPAEENKPVLIIAIMKKERKGENQEEDPGNLQYLKDVWARIYEQEGRDAEDTG